VRHRRPPGALSVAFDAFGERSRWNTSSFVFESWPRGAQPLLRADTPIGASFTDLFRDRLVGRTLSSELRNAGSNPAPGTERDRAHLVRLEAADTAPRRCTDTCALWGALFDNSSLCEVAKELAAHFAQARRCAREGTILGSSSRAQHRSFSLGSGFVLGRRPAL
jgi:hypothetical protein